MKRDYYQDVALLDTNVARFWFAAMFVGLAVLPFAVSGYTLYLINFMAANIGAAIGLNILTGNTGQISLGHAGFVAMGAYGTVLLMVHAGAPFPVALVLAALAAAGFGFLLGFPALRLEGPYLAVVTLGFGLAVTQVIGRWPLFGGRMGLAVPAPSIGPFSFVGDRAVYLLVIATTVVLALAARNLLRTRVGRAFQAIRNGGMKVTDS